MNTILSAVLECLGWCGTTVMGGLASGSSA